MHALKKNTKKHLFGKSLAESFREKGYFCVYVLLLKASDLSDVETKKGKKSQFSKVFENLKSEIRFLHSLTTNFLNSLFSWGVMLSLFYMSSWVANSYGLRCKSNNINTQLLSVCTATMASYKILSRFYSFQNVSADRNARCTLRLVSTVTLVVRM